MERKSLKLRFNSALSLRSIFLRLLQCLGFLDAHGPVLTFVRESSISTHGLSWISCKNSKYWNSAPSWLSLNSKEANLCQSCSFVPDLYFGPFLIYFIYKVQYAMQCRWTVPNLLRKLCFSRATRSFTERQTGIPGCFSPSAKVGLDFFPEDVVGLVCSSNYVLAYAEVGLDQTDDFQGQPFEVLTHFET